MNAAAYLRGQGWRGEGFSLDTTDRGLAKPLLVSHKIDQRGLGTKANDWNQWWLNAFDNTAKGSKTNHQIETSNDILSKGIVKAKPLYTGFVQAETLKSTILYPKIDARIADGDTAVSAMDLASDSALEQKQKKHKKNKKDELHSITVEGTADKTVVEKKSKKEKIPNESNELIHNGTNGTIAPTVSKKFKATTNSNSGEDAGETVILEKKPKKEKKTKAAKDGKSESSKKRKRSEPENVEATVSAASIDGFSNISGPLGSHHPVATGVDDLESSGSLRKAKKLKTNEDNKMHSGPNYAATNNAEEQQMGDIHGQQSEQNSTIQKSNSKENKIGKKRAKQLRAERKKAKEEERTEMARRVLHPEAEVQKPQIEDRPPHPLSIAGLRAAGNNVDIPGDDADPDPLRRNLIRAFEMNSMPRVKGLLSRAFPTPGKDGQWIALVPGTYDPMNPPKRESYKKAKYERESRKRETKREARHWVNVRANLHDFKPDGSALSNTDRGLTAEQVKAERDAKRQREREEKLIQEAEKNAKKELKEQMKVERRVARKMIRSQKKIENHHKMMSHISAKIQRQKREKDEVEAAALGLPYEEFIERREKEQKAKQLERDTANAAARGISLEEYRAQREEHVQYKELEKEARKLGLSVDEYANQPAEIELVEDTQVGNIGGDNLGASDGTYQHWGRSPIDKIWAKRKAEIEAEEKSNDGNIATTHGDAGTSAGEAGDDFISLNEPTALNPIVLDSTGKSQPDHVPSAQNPIVLDTTGALPTPQKLVKDISKAERQARLEALKQRRAKRAEASGEKKMTKNERRKARSRRKETLINKMTTDLLLAKKKVLEDKQSSQHGAGDTGVVRISAGAREEQRKIAEYGTGLMERKQARREARRIMRGVKKGKVTEDEIMPGWSDMHKIYKVKKSQPMALSGNGGREPLRPGEKGRKVSFWDK